MINHLKQNRHLIVYITSFILFLLGTLTGRIIMQNQKDSNPTIEQRLSGYTYISPLLSCNNNPETNNIRTKELKSKLTNFINKNKEDQRISKISIYYQDLSNGPWFEINPEESYAAASLNKVPLLITLYQYAQTHPEIFEQKVTYQGQYEKHRNNELEYPEETFIPGQTYTVEEVSQKMIIYSDNIAVNLMLDVLNKIDPTLFLRTEKDLKIKREPYDDPTTTPQAYSQVFTLLYNASYLNKEMSQKALELLTKTNFSIGLVAGVDPAITVAHKFGFRPTQNEFMLHDCGIVYKPNQPYLLCTMTRGNDLDTLIETLGKISNIVYNHLNQNN